MNTFSEFDPLKAKQTIESEVAIFAVKREIRNILDSYVGWYDPFCELIQNALDSIEEKISKGGKDYKPTLNITIDIADNSIIVTDNGMGLDKQKYEQFLAPSFSFKSGKTRGHKGVGATYLAYGFNYIQISTKTASFQAVGKMLGARDWLDDENPAGNPLVIPDANEPKDDMFNNFETGVSIYLKFDGKSHPGDLSWIRADTAEKWHKILTIKTGLGAFYRNDKIHVNIKVLDKTSKESSIDIDGIEYFWPHQIVRRSNQCRNIFQKADELFKKKGKDFKLPSSMLKSDAIFDIFDQTELDKVIKLDQAEKDIIAQYRPVVYACYMFSAKTWTVFNDTLALRQNIQIITSGIQIAANNMPQGEMYQIPLRRNIGRQHQVHCVFHFDNCKADLGRKGFQKDIVEFCGTISRKLIEGPFSQLRYTLRPITGAINDLGREAAVEEWKDEMIGHESAYPLEIKNQNFFIPTKKISITSVPTREQDVIALFNQLIAGGVIRGIRIMSTNERFTYRPGPRQTGLNEGLNCVDLA